MKRTKSIFNTGTGRSAKLDYEMLINNISDSKYKFNDTYTKNRGVKPYPQFSFAKNESDDCSSQ